MSKVQVVPAILEKDFDKIEERMRSVSGLVTYVQVDICDGKFVPSKTFGSVGCVESFTRLRNLANDTKLGIELDMMVDLDTKVTGRFNKWMESIKASGAKAIVFHYGSTQNWRKVFKSIDDGNRAIGLGVHTDTPIGKVFEMLSKYNFKYIQIMGIENVGYGGQEFSEKALDIIKEIHRELPGVMVSIDGGVNLETIDRIVNSGVQQVASGSAIFKAENIHDAIRLLQA